MLDFPTWFDRVLESLAEIPHPALHALIRSNHAAIREMAREVYDEKVRVARSDGRFDQAVRELRAAVAEARWQPSVDMLTAESTGGTYQATGPGFTTLTLRWDATRHAWFDVRRGPGTGFELTSGTGGIIEVLQAVTAWVREHPVRSGGVRTMADRAPEGKVLAFSPPAGAPPAAPIVTGINTAARQAGWTINHLGFDVPARKVSFDASRPDGRTLTMRGTFDRATLLSEAFPQYPNVEGHDISPLSRWSGTPDELFKVAAQYIADNPYQPAQIPAAPVRALAALPDVIEADVDALVDTSEPELEVVKNDRGILIRGNTRAHKDAIKALQFDGLVAWKWSGNLNAWYPRVRKGTDVDQVAVDLEVALNAQGIDTEITDERTGEAPAPRPARTPRAPRAPRPAPRVEARPKTSSKMTAINNFEPPVVFDLWAPDKHPRPSEPFLLWTTDFNTKRVVLAFATLKEGTGRYWSATREDVILEAFPWRGGRVVHLSLPDRPWTADQLQVLHDEILATDESDQFEVVPATGYLPSWHIAKQGPQQGMLTPGYLDGDRAKWVTDTKVRVLGGALARFYGRLAGHQVPEDAPVFLLYGSHQLLDVTRPGSVVRIVDGEVVVRVDEAAAPRKGQEPGLKLGDILVTSWGYDQTNAEFFKVVRVSPSGATVDVRQIASQRTDEHHVVPAEPHRFVGDVHKGRRVSGTSIKSPIHGYARLWSGSPAYVTPYGQGH